MYITNVDFFILWSVMIGTYGWDKINVVLKYWLNHEALSSVFFAIKVPIHYRVKVLPFRLFIFYFYPFNIGSWKGNKVYFLLLLLQRSNMFIQPICFSSCKELRLIQTMFFLALYSNHIIHNCEFVNKLYWRLLT